MTKKTTRDAALSRLFGAEGQAAEKEEPSERADNAPREERADQATRNEELDAQESGGQDSSKGEGLETGGGAPNSEKKQYQKEEAAQEVRSGYIGLGRYAREDGILERITPYVRPDQAEALRVAVARKRDARGRDISRIIQSLLDEAGYCQSKEEPEG